MLKLGEKIIYESSNNFELGTFGKLQLGEKKIYITNLGNIIIEDNSNFLKKEATTYEYIYSIHKQKLKIRIENSFIILYSDKILFETKSNSSHESTSYKFSLKLSFVEFKDICENQREFIGDFNENQGIIRLDDNNLILGKISRIENEFIVKLDETSININLKDIETCSIDNNNLRISGYFYIKDKDEIIKNIYIYSNDKKLYEKLEEEVSNNEKIGDLPESDKICYGQIYGSIDEKEYKEDEVFIVKHNKELIFIQKANKHKIITLDMNKSSKLILEKALVFFDNENLFTIITSGKNIEDFQLNSLKNIENQNIGFTNNNMPFFMKHNETYLSLYKSAKKLIISIRNNEIKDILINNETPSNHEDFTLVEIRFATNRMTVNLKNDIIAKLIKDVFMYSKTPVLKNSSIENIYMNWAKSVNDMILFNFFGNLYYMKEEIDKIVSQEISDDDRANIVNIIFYQIQEQKNQLDILSAYMPKAIEYGEIKLFKKYNMKIERKPFRLLQKQLFAVSNQINRHLADIERSISQLSFVIYSEFNTREYNTKLKSKQAGIGMAVSVAASVVAGSALSIPFLAMQGMNLYSTKKMDEKSKEIESSKLKLFTNQAIEKLNHLVVNMYPYYVSEANDSFFDLFKILGRQYEKLEDDRVKDELFERIADIYVSKQMTLNNMTNIRKKDLVGEIYKTIDSNMNTYDANTFLLGGIN